MTAAARIRGEIDAVLADWAYHLDHGPLPAQSEVIGAVNAASAPDSVMVCAAGSMPGDLAKLWRVRDPKGYHVEYGYSCMGYEIAGALGVKLAWPQREVIVMVAVPIQRFRTVRGALLLSTQGADIDQTVAAERLSILKVFLIAAGVSMLLSVLLAGTIAGPVRRLADSADRVRRRLKGRVEIPDFTTRRDEIGHLSGNLREMTDALYNRIEAIESFAADVAHELKNPLTSLASAVESAPSEKRSRSRFGIWNAA